jgi:hypothetical protein
MRSVVALPSGAVVNTAAGLTVTCGVLSNDDGGGNDGGCWGSDAIATGHSFVVGDECNGQATGTRVIFGVAADGVAHVRLDFANGSSETAPVTNSGFGFQEQLSPASVAVAKVDWLDGTGSVIRSTPFLKGVPPGCEGNTIGG